MKKVLLMGSELGKGGAERSISLLSYYLEKKYDVTLCILSGTAREKYYRTCEKVVFVDPPPYTGAWGKIKAWRHRIKTIKALKRDNNIDVSISFLEGPDYVNVITRGKEKIVLSIRGSKMYDKVIAGKVGQVRKKVLIPRLYKKADEIVCVSHALAGELNDFFGIPKRKLKTIYNFYETDDIISRSNEPLTEEEAKLFSKPVIITSGRLHVSKQHDKLIHIMHQLKAQADARLMILGDGELKGYLTALAQSLGLKVCDWETTRRYEDADIYLMGFQANAFKFYRHSKMFALSSSWEGFPNVMAEALICAIPVMSTDCYTGPREIFNIPGLGSEQVQEPIRTPIGSLLPMLDPLEDKHVKQWVAEIKHWLEVAAPSQAAFDELTKRFTLDAMLKQWEEVIEQ